jgi:uncharacterized protein (TIGR02246 family)
MEQIRAQKPTPAAVQSEIAATLARAATAYGDGDYEAFVANYLPAEETTMVIYAPGEGPPREGTDLVLRGVEAIRGFYADAPMFKPEFDRPRLSYERVEVDLIAPDVVKVVALMVLTGGDPRVPPAGVTSLVMRHADGRWLIVHDHTH